VHRRRLFERRDGIVLRSDGVYTGAGAIALTGAFPGRPDCEIEAGRGLASGSVDRVDGEGSFGCHLSELCDLVGVGDHRQVA
jgi:hypothetical protein